MNQQERIERAKPCPVRPDELKYFLPLETARGDVRTMLELGNKKHPEHGTYKAWFEALGIRHVSVDWNGEDGALPLDLRMPIKAGLLRAKVWAGSAGRSRPEGFDLVSNIGTTEHVGDTWEHQAMAWENIHECCRPGGLVVSVTPYHDGQSWWWHGSWYPTEDFFQDFADLNGYQIQRMATGLEPPNQNLYVRMVKVGNSPCFRAPAEATVVRNQMRPR